jgi:Leucine-rich repeat (LRR) protein
LHELYLANNEITDVDESIFTMPNLRILSLSNNAIRLISIDATAQLILKIDSNPIAQTMPNGIDPQNINLSLCAEMLGVFWMVVHLVRTLLPQPIYEEMLQFFD